MAALPVGRANTIQKTRIVSESNVDAVGNIRFIKYLEHPTILSSCRSRMTKVPPLFSKTAADRNVV